MHILDYLRNIFTEQYTAVHKVGMFWEKFLGLIKAVSIW